MNHILKHRVSISDFLLLQVINMHLLTHMSFNLIVFSSFQYICRIIELMYSKVIYYSSVLMYQTLFNLSQLLDCCWSFPYLTIMNTSYKNLYAERISPSYVISLVYILKCCIPETECLIGFVAFITYMKECFLKWLY